MTWKHAIAAVAGLAVGTGAVLLLRRFRSFAASKTGNIREDSGSVDIAVADLVRM